MKSNAGDLVRQAIDWLTAKGMKRHHRRRYILGAIGSTFCCFFAAGSYLTLMTPIYTSDWSLIVPGAGAETRVSLDRIGQAQSSTSSPFSDKVLSPKVNYKEIATSDPVMAEMARLAELESEELKAPQIKLIDQTSIMQLKLSAPSPEEAQRRAWAHFKSLRSRLDMLRDDEIKTRNQALRNNISDVEVQLKQARQRLLEVQTNSGLASVDQYNQLIAAIETMRRDNIIARALVAEKQSQFDALQRTLGMEIDIAAAVIRINANPEFRKLALSYSVTSASFGELLKRFGSAHPRSTDLRNKLSSITEAISRMRPIDMPEIPEHVLMRILPSEGERFIGMLTDLVGRHAELRGHLARNAEMEASLAELDKRRQKLGAVAAQLDDLQRDHLIANAVFSSALARLDAGKSDHFASYPVLQMMSEPSLNDAPSSPRLIFALLGAIGGSLLSIICWLFAWLHQWFLFRRLERLILPASLLPASTAV